MMGQGEWNGAKIPSEIPGEYYDISISSVCSVAHHTHTHNARIFAIAHCPEAKYGKSL